MKRKRSWNLTFLPLFPRPYQFSILRGFPYQLKFRGRAVWGERSIPCCSRAPTARSSQARVCEWRSPGRSATRTASRPWALWAEFQRSGTSGSRDLSYDHGQVWVEWNQEENRLWDPMTSCLPKHPPAAGSAGIQSAKRGPLDFAGASAVEGRSQNYIYSISKASSWSHTFEDAGDGCWISAASGSQSLAPLRGLCCQRSDCYFGS
jgi:hypothetical protein